MIIGEKCWSLVTFRSTIFTTTTAVERLSLTSILEDALLLTSIDGQVCVGVCAI